MSGTSRKKPRIGCESMLSLQETPSSSSSSNELPTTVFPASNAFPSNICFLSEKQFHASEGGREVLTADEKRKFLIAIKTKGFNVIYTPSKLLEDLPGRTVTDINRFIDLYISRGKTANVQRKRLLRQQSDQDRDEISESTQESKTQSTSCLEQWFKFTHKSMKPIHCQEDMSDQFVDVFRNFAYHSRIEHNNQTYGEVFDYIADCLDLKFPRELNIEDSLVVVSLLQHLGDFIKLHGFEDIRTFLAQINQPKSPLSVVSPSLDIHDSPSMETSNSQSSSLDISESSSQDELQEAKSLMNKYLEECKSLPKIKKIAQCLNPLKVPIPLLESQAEKFKTLEQDLCVVDIVN